jgi:hypothetical protein
LRRRGGAAKRREHEGGSTLSESLEHYRQSIDNIDAALIYMLAERFKVTQAVGRFKANNACRQRIRGARSARSRGCGNSRGCPARPGVRGEIPALHHR